MSANPNLFDGRLAVFHWQPCGVAESSIGQLADNLRAAAPNVNAVVLRVVTGVGWQGKRDCSNPNLAVSSIADIQRWVRELGARGLECHAWAVLRGNVVRPELDRLADIAAHTGVRSLILDLERDQPGALPEHRPAFVGGEAAAAALAVGLRQRVGDDFHLGLMFDPRGANPRSLFIQSIWFPEIDSLHPLVFHRQFGLAPRQALQEIYQLLHSWGKPIYPVLQAWSVPPIEIGEALASAANVHHAPGISLFRYGSGGGGGLSRDELAQVAQRWPSTQPIAAVRRAAPRSGEPPSGVGTTPGSASLPALSVVDPDDERNGLFAIGYYGDSTALAAGWTRDRDSEGRARLYRPASYNNQTLYVGYSPRLNARGLYAIEVFIPRNHAYVRDAHYFIVDYPRGVRRESLAILDQSPHFDVWVPLQASLVNGAPADPPITEFALDPSFPDAGRVNVADITFVDPATHHTGRFEISFGALRWRPVTRPPVSTAVGFDSPVGTEAERAGVFATGARIFERYDLWCGLWYDANPIGSRYWLGDRWAIHTGADLNLSGPEGVLADRFAPVHAIGDGRIISAGFVSSGWKNVIIAEHPLPGEDRVVYARYAHVADLRVQANDTVSRGQPICTIGEYAPNNYHLHFDLSFDPILKTVPGHWPGDNLALVRQVYTDPKLLIQQYHMVR